jgi:hypothetical protein
MLRSEGSECTFTNCSKCYSKVGIKRQLAAVQQLDNALQTPMLTA